MARERGLLGYQPALDGLRAVAIGSVVGYHILGYPEGGYLGVDLFFVLSGFLITTLLLEEWGKYGSVSFRRFYLRRALRLFPALWVMLAASLVIYGAMGFGLRHQLKGVLEGFTYTTNLGIITGHWDGRYGFLWSLSVEEQFYLLWPFVLVLVLRSGRASLVRIAVAVTCVAGLIALVRFAVTPAHVSIRSGSASATRFDSVLVGCAVALVYASGAGRWLRRIATFPVVVAAGLAVGTWLVVTASSPRTIYDGKTFFFSLAAAVVLIAAVEHADLPAWTRWLRWPLTTAPAVFLGRISYAVYLWHLPILIWCDTEVLPRRIGHVWTHIVEIGATLAVSTASYYLVERYFLRQKWRLARTSSHDVDAAPAIAHTHAEPSAVAVVRQ